MRWAMALLAGLVVALLVYLVLLIPTGTSLVPGTTTGDQRESNVAALRGAANEQLSTFLNQDYRTVQSSMNALISGSTGTLHDQLVGSSVTRITATVQYKTKTTGVIQKLSVSRLGGTTATLLAVVTQTVSNSQTTKVKKSASCAAGTVCTRFHLLLSYQRVAGQWKMSNLEYLRA